MLANDEQIKELISTADQFINNKLFDTIHTDYFDELQELGKK